MRNFNIKAAKDDTTTIDIIGKEIGESWWGDSFSMMDAKEELSNIKSGKIIVNISSLGGDVNDALVIYDLLKSHKSNVETNVMGATASAATVIALAGDEVNMSENALFLVHNAWTMAVGNSADLRKTANDLDTYDNRIVNIYEAKTSKNDSEIRDLMAEEKWISASEAKDFGFIDKVYKPTKAAAKISFDGNNKVLPEIPKEIANKIYKQINNSKTMEINEQSIADKVVNGVKEFFNKKEEVAPVETKSEINVDEIVNNAVKAAIDATKTEVESLKAQLAEKETEAINAKANADKAAEDNAKLKANTTKVEAKEDTAENEGVEELAYVNSIKNLIGKLNK